MKKIAIIYASLHGQTKKIAKHMKAHLENLGFQTSLHCAEDSYDEELDADIDGAIMGGPIYAKRYPSSLLEWIPRHKAVLDSKPLAFFSVSLNAADKHEEARKADDEMIHRFIQKSNLSPRMVASFAGSLNYTDYNWFLRFMMRRISRKAGGATDTSRDYEYTNWKSVDAFAENFANENFNSEFAIDRRLKTTFLRGTPRQAQPKSPNPAPT